MNLKPAKKKIRNVLLFLLTIGASLTLGLLSFSGMFVLWPLIPLAIAAFNLAVAYEGEIFWQNIKGAFKTLSGRHALRRQLLREFLHDHINDKTDDLPILLQAYLKHIQDLHALEHQLVHADDLTASEIESLKQRRRLLRDKIKRYEIEFAQHLFDLDSDEKDLSDDVKALRQWFRDHEAAAFQKHRFIRLGLFTVGKLFSIVAGCCICVGTGYLLFDAFMTIPFLAAVPMGVLPVLILSLAAISGIAYALITYNSITSMLNNRTLQNFYQTLKSDFQTHGFSFSNMVKGFGALLFLALTTALTVCTAGTWWTIGQNLAFFIEQSWIIACTVFITLSTFVINLFNTLCTWLGIKEQVEVAISEIAPDAAHQASVFSQIKSLFKQAWQSYVASWAPINDHDHALQKYNPFRILIKILMTPIDWILFIAHVISIGVAGDQIPGIPQPVSATLCAVDEFKEDWHRFFGHSHHHGPLTVKGLLKARSESGGGHEHSLDLPRKCIQILLAPLYLLATVLDFCVMLYTAPQGSLSLAMCWDSFKNACIRQFTGRDAAVKPKKELDSHAHAHDCHAHAKELDQPTTPLSAQKFEARLMVRSLEERLEGPLVRDPVKAQEKIARLKTVEQDIQSTTTDQELKDVLQNASLDLCLSTPRFCFFEAPPERETYTQKAIAQIHDEVYMVVPGIMG